MVDISRTCEFLDFRSPNRNIISMVAFRNLCLQYNVLYIVPHLPIKLKQSNNLDEETFLKKSVNAHYKI